MRKALIVFILTHFIFLSYSQKIKDRTTLEREKILNINRIKKVNKILNETKEEKKNSLNQINAYNEQIESQNNKIELVKEDIELTKNEMVGLAENQYELVEKIKTLQKEYGETIYRESKQSKKLSSIGFLFSASSFQDLFFRYKYLEQYTAGKKVQLAKIKTFSQLLQEKKKILDNKKITQQSLVNQISAEATELEKMKKKQSELVVQLSSRENELKAELEKSKRAISELNSRLSAIIKAKKIKPVSEEIVKREKKMLESRKKASEEVSEFPAIAVSGGFANNKSRLIWPVDGFISDKFGVKNHPVLKGLKVENNGINIQTSEGASVRSVWEGTVLDISQIPGLNNVIAIQHDEYFTVYANLATVNVKVNQTVKIRQVLGKVGISDGNPEINFQIWHNIKKLNPEPWLGNK